MKESYHNYDGSVILLGGEDTGWDDEPDEGKIYIYSHSGAKLDEFTFAEENEKIRFNTLQFKSIQPDFYEIIAFGTSIINNTGYPFALELVIIDDEIQPLGEKNIFWTLPDISFNGTFDLLFLGDNSYYLKGNKFSSDEPEYITIHKISSDFIIIWSQEIIVSSGFRTATYSGNGVYLNGNLFVSGYTEVDRMAADGYWCAGLIAAIDLSGNFNWTNVYDLSGYSDRYISCFTNNNALITCGDYAHYYWTGNNQHFGYGLISKIDPETGAAISHLVFGNDEYETGFNDILVDGNYAFCGGWTEHNYSSSKGDFLSIFPADLMLKKYVYENGSDFRNFNNTKEGIGNGQLRRYD